MNDADLGTLDWNEELELWEGSILLESEAAFELMVFCAVDSNVFQMSPVKRLEH